MFNFTSLSSDPVRLNKIIHETTAALTDEEFIAKQINDFMASKDRKDMLNGERYFKGEHDILDVKRTVIGEGGQLEEVANLPNNTIVDNQYQKMVDQKKNYLLGKPVIFNSSNKKYNELLDNLLNKKFQRLIKNIGEDALNCGIGWLFLNYDDRGKLIMKRLKPYQVIPGWTDFEHEQLDWLIYFYTWETPSGDEIEKVEVYDESGIYRFIRSEDNLIPDEEPFSNYFSVVEEDGQENPFNWLQIPIIPFRYNTKEIPLINKVKSLQDSINQILSTFANNMAEDARNTILILVNYDGQNLGEFRRNLAQYGAVKVRNDSTTGGGDVKTLQVEVNAENYKLILRLFKDALIENARGYDGKDDRMNGQPNQMNIQSMYSDIDLDANEMETEFQASFEQMIYFINSHFQHINQGDFEGEVVDVMFNRDMLINESEIITNIRDSDGIISRKSQIKNHPWITDVDEEMELLESEQDVYDNAFSKVGEVIDEEE